MAWGRIINLAKDSEGDRYYLAVDNNNKLYVGVSVNGSTTVTWVTKQHSVSQDYIVERITWVNPNAGNEVYNVEKWASGFCRISGAIEYTYSLSISNAYGNWYYLSCSGITMPPYLINLTYANLQIRNSGGLHGASIYDIASDFTWFSYYLYSSRSETITPIVYVCFEGRWKQYKTQPEGSQIDSKGC